MNHPESREQAAFVKFLRTAHPCVLFTISPINRTGIRAAIRNKIMGYRKGTPDMTIYEPRGKYHGLVIEFKAPGKKIKDLSDEQHDFLVELNRRNYYAVVCFSEEEAQRIFIKYMMEVL